MQVLSFMTVFWPGLPQLWWRGDWRAVLGALAFGIGLNAVLVAKFAWPGMMPMPLVAPAQWVLAVVWLACAMHSIRRFRAVVFSAATDPTIEDWFRRAQTEYLQGHWFEAESMLKKVLAKQPRDAEAQLLLAATHRRAGQPTKAGHQLDRLQCIDGAEKWALEIRRERQWLQAAVAEENSCEDNSSQSMSKMKETEPRPTNTTD